jgi:gluconokinase
MTFSVGTSAALRLAHREPVIPVHQSTWCYYCAEGLHLVGAATAGAGNCVNWFVKDLLGGSMSYPQLEAAAAAADPDTAPYFLPFNFGERCPGWDDARLGGFCGVGPDSGTGAMYRAVLEGILFNLYQNYLILVENIGRAPSMISVSGGITQSPFWMALAADIFGAPLHENTGEHASLLGAAYMAQRAIGQIASLKDIPAEKGKRQEPDMRKHEEYMKRFEKWLEYYNFRVKNP